MEAALVWAFLLLFVLATVRALTTAINKTYDLTKNGLEESEKLIYREDAEHWWTAVVINALLLSIGVVSAFAPAVQGPSSWHYAYTSLASVVFAVLINYRIERHGWYYRRRHGINLFGRPREEGFWLSLRRSFKGR